MGRLWWWSAVVCFRNLSSVQDREICCYSISCKEQHNIGTSRVVSHCKCFTLQMFHIEQSVMSLTLLCFIWYNICVLLPVISWLCPHINWVPTDVGLSLLMVRRCGTIYLYNCLICSHHLHLWSFTEDISFLRVLACTAHWGLIFRRWCAI